MSLPSGVSLPLLLDFYVLLPKKVYTCIQLIYISFHVIPNGSNLQTVLHLPFFT